jgi:hypothetical protein
LEKRWRNSILDNEWSGSSLIVCADTVLSLQLL